MNAKTRIDVPMLKEKNLPRRDWILLPLLGLITICLLAGTTEIAARRMFSDSKTLLANCMVLDDPTTGPRAIPNSVCWEKLPESHLTEYRFNSCGHRAGMECGPKPLGSYRIVMTGSSVALGEHVDRDKTFAALLPHELLRRTGRSVELYNESTGWGFPPTVSLRFKEIVAAKPDLILWELSPGDIAGAAVVTQVTKAEVAQRSLSLSEKTRLRLKAAFASRQFLSSIPGLFGRTRTALLLRHFLSYSQSMLVKSYLTQDEQGVGFLRADPAPEWKEHLQQLDRDTADIERRSAAAGVPFVAVYVPSGAQAAMISTDDWPSGYDPYKVDQEIRAIIESHGGTFIDILPDYRHIPNPEHGVFPVDGHPNAEGHAMIAQLIAKELTSGAIPALKAAAQPQVALEQAR